MQHSLSLGRVRGQGYDGASNMRGEANCLKTLMMNETQYAYYVHCFSHQLQLKLIGVVNKNSECRWLFEDVLPLLLNFVGGSPKRKEFFREKQKELFVESLSLSEIETSSNLNKELGLARPGDTRWSSHFKAIKNLLHLYQSILESLDEIAKAASNYYNKADMNKAQGITIMLMSFDFVFLAHLIRTIFGIKHALNMALQKRDQYIVNTMNIIDVTKRKLQELRDISWDGHFNQVVLLMENHEIEVPNMDEFYVSRGRRMYRGTGQRVKNLHHYRVDVFYCVIELQLQEHGNQFTEKTKELLICMSCFDPTNRFSSFDKSKLIELAKFYPSEFPDCELMFFEHSLDSFVDDMQHDERFWDVKNLNELSIKLVETKKT